MDNLGYTIMTEDTDSENDSGFRDSFEFRPMKHKDSIVSCASFERDNFLNFLGREEKDLRRDRGFSFQEEYVLDNNRFKTCLHNRFGYNGSEQGQIRNGSGIYHIYNGTVVVTDVLNSCLFIYGASGRMIKCIAIPKGSEPWTTAATPSGAFAVALSREKCVMILTCAGIEKFRIGNDVLDYPSGIIVDRRNRYIVTDIKQNKIHIFSDSGKLIRSIPDNEQGVSLKTPRHVALSHSGDIIVSDSGNHCVKLFDRHGDHVKTFGKYGVNDGELKFPHGICTDSQDNIIVADYYNNRVSMFSKQGKFLQHLVTATIGLTRPQGVAIRNHPSHFILYITYGDMKANKVVAYRIVDSENEKKVVISATV